MKRRIQGVAKHIAGRSFGALSSHLSLWHQVVRDHSILDKARNRTVIGALVFCAAFALISLRLFDVMVFRSVAERSQLDLEKNVELALERGNITDRNGEILATHLITASVYANPKVIINPKEAAEKLCALIPELNYETTLKRLNDPSKGFVWVLRHIPPKLQHAINNLGIPGVYLQKDQRRVYPFGPITAHAVGYCGMDNVGLSGIEKSFDVRLRKDKSPLALSLDIRVQHAVHEVLASAIQEFSAAGANAMVVDITTGELISMVSFPDFDPNVPSQNAAEAAFNHNTLGVREPGSVLKIMTMAIALETGRIHMNSIYDAIHPVKVGRFVINDFKGPNRMVNLQEAFLFSSNLACSRIALDFGLPWQKKYFQSFGFFNKPSLEIPEVGSPLYPKNPTDATLISTSFGYAISLSPLQLMKTTAALINNGEMRELTLLRQKMPVIGAPIVSKKTSEGIRHLMRLVVTEGTGRKAAVKGYPIIGKTGTAYKARKGGYDQINKLTTFMGAFPAHSPRYLLLVSLDSPRPTPKTYGYSTGGWTACPTGGKIIERIAPLLGIAPVEDDRFDIQSSDIILTAHHETD